MQSKIRNPSGILFAPLPSMGLVPRKFFLTKGVGVHQKELRAFENALRDAGIQTCNLITTSSIIAPGCEQISLKEGMKHITPGMITFAVLAQSETNEPGQEIVAGIGMAHPKDPSLYGYFTELKEALGRTVEDAEQDLIEMALENLATEWDPKLEGKVEYRKGKKNYTIEGRDIMVDSVVQSARGAENNQYTVVVAAAIFIYEYVQS